MKHLVERSWRPHVTLSNDTWAQAARHLGPAQQHAPEFEATVRGVLDRAVNAGRASAAVALVVVAMVATLVVAIAALLADLLT